ncbi:acyltransferase [Seonamhaeicola sp. ML3]|uniref:acyltransferase n=1 Tax=Seonamhaeicola sp. ML3 TaxID=2937786 RepID=UPI00200D35BC|nr:acyltransferase family protein [Seonamhaeicola sp. ML3]
MKGKIISASENQFGISLLRIISTISVIIIHVSGPLVVQYGEISQFKWNVANVFDSFSRYSIPMFFMISGALLLNRDYNLKDFLKKRFIKILPAFLVWSLVYSIANRYFFNNEIFDLKKVFRDIFYGSEYHLWFVYVLLGLYLFTPILRPWIKNATSKNVLYVLGVWVVTLFAAIPVLNNYLPKIDLAYFSGFIGYFILGFYLTNWNTKSRLMAVLAIVSGLSITVLGTYFMTIRNGGFYDFFYEYLSLNALMVSYGVFVSLNKIKPSNIRVNRISNIVSQCCYGIFLMHPLVLKLFNLIGFNVYLMNPLLSIALVSVTCFLTCFIIVFGLRQLKIGYLIS